MGLVLSLCDRLKPLVGYRSEQDMPTVYAYIIGLHSLYARPFKQRSPLKLSDAVVPQNMRSTHNSLITFRDKLFVHLDQGADAVQTDAGEVLGKMLLVKSENGFQCTMSSILPLSSTLKEVSDLAQRVRSSCQYHLQKIMKRYEYGASDLLGGVYEVNLGPPGVAPIFVSSEAMTKGCMRP